MTRQRVVVVNGTDNIVYIEEDLQSSGIEHGVLKLQGCEKSVTFAPGAWTRVDAELIED